MLIKKLVPVQKNNFPQSLLVPANDMAKSPDNHRPLELVFVRHGESEGNVAVKAAERGDTSYFTPEFRKRHSSTWDLTKKGIQEGQAPRKRDPGKHKWRYLGGPLRPPLSPRQTDRRLSQSSQRQME